MTFFLFFWRSPKIGQKNRLNYCKDLFFLKVILIWVEKPIAFRAKFKVIFWKKFGAPQILLNSYAHGPDKFS